jgi:hypothetical protein
MVGLGILCDD